MVNRTITEILKDAWSKIDTPEKWIKHWSAMSNTNVPASPLGVEACKFCSVGALMNAVGNSSFNILPAKPTTAIAKVGSDWDRAYALFRREFKEITGEAIAVFNDSSTTTHEDIKVVWLEIIARAERRGL